MNNLSQKTFGMNGCTNCLSFRHCGGHPLPLISRIGCVNYTKTKPAVDTDDMNPLFPERFWQLWDDVGGLDDFTISSLRSIPAVGLPKYVPLFQHRYSSRSRLLPANIVALRLFDIIGRRKTGAYAPKYSSASELRAAYGLHKDTVILLVGVDDDAPLEQFWARHRVSTVCQALASLKLLGVTAPNFSYFTCVPRFQILRNRKRILLTAERFSKAGIATSIHLNANSPGDWKFWEEFLGEHAEISVVTMEFQTGARACEEVGNEAFNALVTLNESIGRRLHPLLVGGGRYYERSCDAFKSFTVVDSQPFMQALSRQTIVEGNDGKFGWTRRPTAPGERLDDLFERNLSQYEACMLGMSKERLQSPVSDPNQLIWDSIASTPNFTAQPFA